ncbi:Phosphatidylinositol-4-phosphate 5-Kinase [Carpediemonas membranifera]|uniref:Phosphatidylinositol-4-phosphate 5-Kinase n=1 Tax=Carpediemonas membranifera TaxID=201153 RepID=A0A8J6AXY4_9EUKA|nr:Phosphatidylinositol-4-phosphate 5-Kinase [Carpediemonas membranifera]|eukprot:KAG9395210.1 Phosphatidylinositol-4-phosphate 5-Kinase [Carpediemonas membranifera]
MVSWNTDPMPLLHLENRSRVLPDSVVDEDERLFQARTDPSTARGLWLEDEMSPKCFFCGLEFSTIHRRSHCRGCGRCSCRACLTTGVLFPGSAAVKLCHRCTSLCAFTDLPALGSGELKPESKLRAPGSGVWTVYRPIVPTKTVCGAARLKRFLRKSGLVSVWQDAVWGALCELESTTPILAENNQTASIKDVVRVLVTRTGPSMPPAVSTVDGFVLHGQPSLRTPATTIANPRLLCISGALEYCRRDITTSMELVQQQAGLFASKLALFFHRIGVNLLFTHEKPEFEVKRRLAMAGITVISGVSETMLRRTANVTGTFVYPLNHPHAVPGKAQRCTVERAVVDGREEHVVTLHGCPTLSVMSLCVSGEAEDTKAAVAVVRRAVTLWHTLRLELGLLRDLSLTMNVCPFDTDLGDGTLVLNRVLVPKTRDLTLQTICSKNAFLRMDLLGKGDVRLGDWLAAMAFSDRDICQACRQPMAAHDMTMIARRVRVHVKVTKMAGHALGVDPTLSKLSASHIIAATSHRGTDWMQRAHVMSTQGYNSSLMHYLQGLFDGDDVVDANGRSWLDLRHIFLYRGIMVSISPERISTLTPSTLLIDQLPSPVDGGFFEINAVRLIQHALHLHLLEQLSTLRKICTASAWEKCQREAATVFNAAVEGFEATNEVLPTSPWQTRGRLVHNMLLVAKSASIQACSLDDMPPPTAVRHGNTVQAMLSLEIGQFDAPKQVSLTDLFKTQPDNAAGTYDRADLELLIDSEPMPAPHIPQTQEEAIRDVRAMIDAADAEHAPLELRDVHRMGPLLGLNPVLNMGTADLDAATSLVRSVNLPTSVAATVVCPVLPDELSSLVCHAITSAEYMEVLRNQTADRVSKHQIAFNQNPRYILDILNTLYDDDLQGNIDFLNLDNEPINFESFINNIAPPRDASDIEISLPLPSVTARRDINYRLDRGTDILDCTIFYPLEFHALRQHHFGSQDLFLQAMMRCAPFSPKGGKSGSTFLRTRDGRFILKQVSRLEMTAFIDNAKRFFTYWYLTSTGRVATVLVPTYGLYSVTIAHKTRDVPPSKLNFVVIANVSYGRDVLARYDLKGSMRNRLVDRATTEDVAQDMNVVTDFQNNRLLFKVPDRDEMLIKLHNDSLFLSRAGVIDYSLFLHVDGQRFVGLAIIDYIRSYTIGKQVESVLKSLQPQSQPPTIINPLDYRLRFTQAMTNFFTAVPDADKVG